MYMLCNINCSPLRKFNDAGLDRHVITYLNENDEDFLEFI